MKISIITIVVLLAAVACSATSKLSLLSENGIHDHEHHLNATEDTSLSLGTNYGPSFGGAIEDGTWNKAVEIGVKLWSSLSRDDKAASWWWRTDPQNPDPLLQTVQSPFDGDCKDTLAKWGYAERPQEWVDRECDFGKYHRLKRAFDDLGIRTASKGKGGPNECFQIDHRDGPAIIRDKDGNMPLSEDQTYKDESCDKIYRVTGATFGFGLNAESGMITLLDVISAAHSAKSLWKRDPLSSELPQFRSISDLAWGLWNRVSADDLTGINYFMTTIIINEDTRFIIRRALETLTPKRTEVAVWPGFDFVSSDPAGQALMGSPVGRWAGYFLMQHKKQLGGNKYISKIRVFKPDDGFFPYMLFYVAGPAPVPLPLPGPDPPQPEQPEPETSPAPKQKSRSEDNGTVDTIEEVQAKGAKDSRHVSTEHIFRARL